MLFQKRARTVTVVVAGNIYAGISWHGLAVRIVTNYQTVLVLLNLKEKLF